jgi:hypothetical protein
VRFALLLALFAAPASHAWAWSHHSGLMPYILAEGLPTEIQQRLDERGSPTRDLYPELARELALQPGVRLPALREPISLRSLLMSGTTDEPDQGMDQNLDDAADPMGERAQMGGKTGATSQGFRHMYFGGWQWRHPLLTFQIPLHAVGQAPARTELLARRARALIRGGDVYWGTRVLAWAIHFVQDLAQPFHAVQIPALEMVPWERLRQWPPAEGWKSLVRETTRTISNYHWAYEEYVDFRLNQGEKGPFHECLAEVAGRSPLRFDPRADSPETLARRTAAASVELGGEVGAHAYGLFGAGLKQDGVDLPRGAGTPDYESISIRPDHADERRPLDEATCRALQNAVQGSRFLIEWAFAPGR